jgi:hypothetical protein|tara:strand:- start:325 stop:438 length:114 start_codon:yes stop_codon:yes gene_type:complete
MKKDLYRFAKARRNKLTDEDKKRKDLEDFFGKHWNYK